MNELPEMKSTQDLERVLEFEFVRATENAALQAIHWLGRGEKELADASACDAIHGIFDLLDIQGRVVIGEGIKDNAPGIFLGEKLGTWKPGSPAFDIALDPVDGTTNLSKGLPNSISVIAAAQVTGNMEHAMRHLPSYYSEKFAYGPAVHQALLNKGIDSILDFPIREVLQITADALGKQVRDLVVVTLDRPRHDDFISAIRKAGAALRMISDGDITAAVAPALPDSGVDLYYGIGGTPEGILTAAAMKCIGGNMNMRMWFQNESQRRELANSFTNSEIAQVYQVADLVIGESALFCATGISDSPLLPGVRLMDHRAETHSILMRARSGTVRHINAIHDLRKKHLPLRSR